MFLQDQDAFIHCCFTRISTGTFQYCISLLVLNMYFLNVTKQSLLTLNDFYWHQLSKLQWVTECQTDVPLFLLINHANSNSKALCLCAVIISVYVNSTNYSNWEKNEHLSESVTQWLNNNNNKNTCSTFIIKTLALLLPDTQSEKLLWKYFFIRISTTLKCVFHWYHLSRTKEIKNSITIHKLTLK